MKNQLIACLCAITLTAWIQPAQALEASDSLDIRGFVSTAATDTTTRFSMIDLGSNGTDLTFTKNTIFGLNLRWTLSNEWSAMGQVVGRGNYNRFGLNVNWGFIEWKAHPKFIVKLGRVVTPLWLYSQQVDIAHSYPWVVLPTEVYGLANILRSLDGFSILLRQPSGDGLFQLDFTAGTSVARQDLGSVTSPVQIDIDLKSAFGIELSYELQNKLLMRIAYDQANVTATSTVPVVVSASITAAYTTPLSIGKTDLFASGLRYEHEYFHFISEWVRRISEGNDYKRAAGVYGSLGVPVGRWMPYFLYSTVYDIVGNAARHPDSAVSALQTDGQTLSVGLNWNASDSIVFKSQVGHSTQTYTNRINNFSYNFIQLGAAATF